MTPKQKQKPWDDERYEVIAWGHEGEIVKRLWDASYEEAEEVRGQYEDEPGLTVDIRERD